eukprot:TRINITY_DN10150_c0_g1_i1.p1 TRINITY_DN10150_c0_g1~~TRINITY_DN10150_c0_g1_i1.p1  ORF type:complete len:565 (-),score=187.89 TRINITY_DN10150_c0_g1_i1:274-1935(-)
MNPENQTPNQTSFQTGSLYVGDLEQNVTESVLFDVFRKVGPVASIRVCRDSSTRRSLGYAYVNYHRVEDAERAIDTLNYTPIIGVKPCRIMWSQRDPYIRKSGVGNIFIKDLHPSIQSQDLYDNFSQFGTILSCKVETDTNGVSKGFGYVHFENMEAAQKAIDGTNGIELEGKKISVTHFKNKKQRSVETTNAPKYTNIFVKNLNPKISENELKEKFSQYGEITSLVIMFDDNKISKGFGFINYKTPEAAIKAVEELHEKEFLGTKVYVAKAQKKSERLSQLRKQFEERKLKFQDSNLYIKNLDDQIDDKKLLELFSSYGDITSSRVMRDDNNVSKGFGFVCFASPEDAQKAATELNGRMLFNKPLYVALAQRKEIRTAQLQAQYSHRIGKNNMTGGLPFNNNNNNNNNQFNNNNNRGNMPYMNKRYPNNNRGPNNNQLNNNNYRKKNPHQMNQTRNNPNVEQSNINNIFSIINNTQDPEQKKRIIGDVLYQNIENFFKQNPQINFNDAGKITGMLLESLDEHELINLIEDQQELVKKIEEAVNVLQEHMENN